MESLYSHGYRLEKDSVRQHTRTRSHWRASTRSEAEEDKNKAGEGGCNERCEEVRVLAFFSPFDGLTCLDSGCEKLGINCHRGL